MDGEGKMDDYKIGIEFILLSIMGIGMLIAMFLLGFYFMEWNR